jgi:hypothetical protein
MPPEKTANSFCINIPLAHFICVRPAGSLYKLLLDIPDFKWKSEFKSPRGEVQQLYGGLAKYLGSIFHGAVKERESRIVEGHIARTMCICGSRYRQNMLQPKWQDVSKGKAR